MDEVHHMGWMCDTVSLVKIYHTQSACTFGSRQGNSQLARPPDLAAVYINTETYKNELLHWKCLLAVEPFNTSADYNRWQKHALNA